MTTTRSIRSTRLTGKACARIRTAARSPPVARGCWHWAKSFTFGWGVDAAATFPRLLDNHVAADGTRLESINAGVIGYGPDNEAAWLAAHGWALQPRLVLVGFYAGNDVRDVMLGRHKSHVDPRGRLLGGAQDPPAPPDGPAVAEHWLGEHSQAYLLLRNLAYNLTHPAQSATPPAGPALPIPARFCCKPSRRMSRRAGIGRSACWIRCRRRRGTRRTTGGGRYPGPRPGGR